MDVDCRVTSERELVNAGTIGHIGHSRIIFLAGALGCAATAEVIYKNLEVSKELIPTLLALLETREEFVGRPESDLQFLIDTRREEFDEANKLLDIKPEPYYTKFSKSRKKGSRNGYRK